MQRASLVASLCLVVLLIASVAAWGAPEWQIQLRASAGSNTSGNCYVGAYANPPASIPATTGSVQLYESRTDGTNVATDYRALCADCTYVWSNWHLVSTLNKNTVITVAWQPGAGSDALPAGSFVLYDITNSRQYDLSSAGSFTLTVGQSNAVADFRIICTVGNGPSIYKALWMTPARIDCAPIVDFDGYVYFGLDSYTGVDNSGKIYKVHPDIAPTPTVLSVPSSGNVRGRIAAYGDYVYGTTNTGKAMRCPKSGSSGTWKVSENANFPTTPAVDNDGYVYIGSANQLKKLDSSGKLKFASPDLGGAVGSPSIPGSNMIWVNAGSKLLCLNSDMTVRSEVVPDAGGTVGNPVTFWNRSITAATGGNKLRLFASTTLAPLQSYTAGGAITNSPFMDPEGNVYFAADDHKLYCVSIWNMAARVYPLPGSGAITGTAIPVGNTVAIAGGDDCRVYLVDKTSGAVRVVVVNQPTRGCVTDANGSKAYFASLDGNLYIVQ